MIPMKIAIMQPYFFPYIGQFQLANAVDRFISLDDVQYIRHGWVNRNRILKPDDGFQYIIVPLKKHSRGTTIKDISTVDEDSWKKTILRQLEHYKKRAPYYRDVHALVSSCLETGETNIAKLNGSCFSSVCDYLGIHYKMELSSSLGLDYSGISDPQDWALRISEQLKASQYLNPPGGMELFDPQKFSASNIELNFVVPNLSEYNQYRQSFTPGLSIIDVMMFNSKEQIHQMLNDYQLL